MTPERWAQVKELFARALELPNAERSAFVERASAGDRALRDEVASLLAASSDSASFPSMRAGVAAAARRALGDEIRAGRPSAPFVESALHSLLESALGRQYEIVRCLGSGGMGAVYLARERALERFVAIKVLRSDLADAVHARERFRREARIAAQLSHPGIVPLHTFGEVAGVWYFVMGYVRGVSLADRLRTEPSLPVAEAHRILVELADALDCAHRNGVVHRDIKPANVLLDETTGRAVLADFGIAKLQGGDESLTESGAVIGTPEYMSPEQARGAHDVDERSDIYALGAVGYTMLAGRDAFMNERRSPILGSRGAHFVSLATLVPATPAALASAIMRCLADEPAMRWPNAASLREALARADDASLTETAESVRDLPTFGPYALLWAMLWAAFAVRPYRSPGDRVLLLLIALLVPVGLMLHLWNVSGDGLRLRELARVAFWPPEWWGMWWPRALRRPSDLWPRLPRPPRLTRIALSAFIVTLPAMILTREWVEATVGGTTADVGQRWFNLAESLLLSVVLIVVVATMAWARQHELNWREAARMLFGATLPSPAWRSPTMSRLLAVPLRSVPEPRRDDAADHGRIISDMIAQLPPSLSAMGAHAEEATKSAVRAVEECDRELAVIGQHATSSELDRLSARVGALESTDNAADDTRELARLMELELGVLRRMRLRFELLSLRRTRLLSCLRGLWLQLCALHDHPAAQEQTIDRLVALTNEMLREVSGASEGAAEHATR